MIESIFSGDVYRFFIEASLGNSMLKEVANAMSRDDIAKNNFTKLMLSLTIIWT